PGTALAPGRCPRGDAGRADAASAERRGPRDREAAAALAKAPELLEQRAQIGLARDRIEALRVDGEHRRAGVAVEVFDVRGAEPRREQLRERRLAGADRPLHRDVRETRESLVHAERNTKYTAPTRQSAAQRKSSLRGCFMKRSANGTNTASVITSCVILSWAR